jgi:gliding motility-associated-like protein
MLKLKHLLCFITLSFVVSTAHAQLVSVPFDDGFIGNIGSNSQDARSILKFSTLGISKSAFIQQTNNGQFYETQGNDIGGKLRLYFSSSKSVTISNVTTSKTYIDIDGAIVWRGPGGGVGDYYGFLPNPNTNITFNYGVSSTYTISRSSNGSTGSNIGNLRVDKTLSFTDGTNEGGNAAGVLTDLNGYLSTAQSLDPSGPVTVTSQTTSNQTPTITGTATLGAGESLSVTVNGVVYTVGDGNLTRSGTTWTLVIPTSLAFDTYSVEAIITNSNGFILTDGTSSELVISQPPSITATGTLTNLSTCLGTASASQTFTVSAQNLTANLVLTAPVGYELATTSGGTYSSTLSIVPTSGTVSARLIYVRLSSSSINGQSGTISITSTGATSQSISTGTASVINSVGGSIAGSATVCAGTNSTVLTLSGQTGSISKWQSSLTSNFASATDIANTTVSLTATNLSATTYYRAVITEGSCTSANSSVASITVNPLPTISVTPSSATIVTGNSVTLTASGASTYSWSPSASLSASNTSSVSASPTTTTTYTVTGVSASSCSNTANVTVTVNQALVAGAIAADQTICVGATPATLTSTTPASGGVGTINYQWETSANNSTWSDVASATSATYSPGAISANTYYRRKASTVNDAAVYTSSVMITVQQSVGGSIAGSAAVCAGTNSTVLTLSGYTGSITKWQSSLTSNFASATDINSTTASITATNLSSTTYYRAVVTLGSCTSVNSSVASVTVNVLPSISVNVIPDVTTSATTFSIPYTGLSAGADRYSLTVGTTAMTNFVAVSTASITTSPLTISIPASVQNGYDFNLTVNNSTTGCTSAVVPFILSVTDISPGTLSSDQTICYGTTPATITSATDAGVGSPTYIWQISTNGHSGTYTDIAGATSASYSHPVALTATTHFRRKATIGSSIAITHPVEVLVNALPTVTVTPSSASITVGSSVNLTASGATTYSWSPSTGLSATNTAAVTATPTATTTYTVTGTSSSCSSTSTVTVTVNPALTAGSISANQTICVGATPATLTSSTAAAGGTGTITYEWQSSTDGTTYTTISGAASATYSPAATSVNTYFKRGARTANDNVVYSSAIVITVQQSVGGSIAGSATVCAGTNSTVLTLSGQTGSITKWQSSLTSNFASATDIANTTTSLTATNLSVTTYYRAVITQGSCTAANSATATISVTALPTVTVTPSSASITTGSSVNLTASGATTYSWSPSTGLSATNTAAVTATPTATTTYTVTGTSSSCSSTSTVTVTVNPALTAGSISANQTICVGATPATLTSSTAAAGGTGTITYEWQSSTDGTTYTTISGAASATYSPAATSVNTYFKRGARTANDNVVYSSAIVITVQQSVGGSIAGSATVCAGTNSTVLTLSGQTGSITKWQSSLTSNFASATDIANTTTSLTATNLSVTTYYRAVITQGSCTAANSATATISVTALPTVTVTPSSASITVGSSVTLTASGANTYSWSPSTGLSATNTAAVTATPTATTTYTVTGTRSSCSSTATVTVTVTAANNTPADTDGDGVLDTTETTDGTDPNDGCSYVAASKTLTPSAAWNALDCDGDGTPNGTDTAPKDPCIFAVGATPVTTNAIWRAADCDGDGVTNGKEADDGTDPNNGCDYKVASRTLTPSAAWGTLDCDKDGNPNGTDPNIDRPTASNDVANVPSSGTVTVNILVNDDFLPGANIELTRQVPPNQGTAKGTVTFNPLTGEMTYKRAPFESGLVTMGYIVTNNAVSPPVSAIAFVTIMACDLTDPLSDCDGDGEPNGTDLAPNDPCVYEPTRQVKTKVSDDWKALDCDGDGVLNGTELADGTNAADGCSFKAASITLTPSAAWLALDCDADGISNKVEGTQDFDGDGIPNCLDADSDGDSISDKLETTVDTDKDGKPDYLDLDSDNDGILDFVENKVCTGTGILCDTDADGFPNFRDLDSDDDKISDVIEANGSDFNRDGIADGNIDEKGIPSSANKGLTPPDTDRDGKLDPYDVDSDGDGILDFDEEFNVDADFADCDKDGIANRLDPDECEIFSPQGISPNGDGKNDRLVFKGLFLRKIPNHLSIFNRWGTLVFEMESYDNSFEGTLLPDGTYYYILDFFGKKPTISNYLSVDRTIK